MGEIFFFLLFPAHPSSSKQWSKRLFLFCLGGLYSLSLLGCLNQGGQCRSNHTCEKGFACFRGLCLRVQHAEEALPPETPDAHPSENSEPSKAEISPTEDMEHPSEPALAETEPPEIPVEIKPESYTPDLPWIRFVRADLAIAITDQQRHPNGDIFVGGWFHGKQAQMAGLSVHDDNTNNRQAFLLRLSPAGSARWVKVWGSEGDESLTAIAISSQGEIYITGTFTSALLSVGSSRFVQKGKTSSFLAKLDNDGEVLWTRSAGGDGDTFASDLATGEDDALYVAGQMYGKDIQLFDGRLYSMRPSAGIMGTDFLLRLDRDGKYRWTLAYGTSAQGTTLPKIAVAPTNTSPPSSSPPLYITHRFAELLPAPSIKSAGLRAITDGQDPYLMHVRPDGFPAWADLFYATSGNETPQALCTATSGAFWAGTYRGNLFSSEHIPLFSSPQESGWIGHWDTQGKLRWTQTITATTETSAVRIQSLAYTPQAIHILGDFQGDIQLPDAIAPNHKAQSTRDIFLAEIDPQGRWRHFRTIHGTQTQSAQGRLLADPNGSFVLSGTTDSPTIVWGTYHFPTPHDAAKNTTAFILHTERIKP